MSLIVGVLLIAFLAFGFALMRSGAEADLAPLPEYPEVLAVYRSPAAPRCPCGALLRVNEWGDGRCGHCRGDSR